MQEREQPQVGLPEGLGVPGAAPRSRQRRHLRRRHVARHVGGAVAAQRHSRDDEAEPRRVATHDGHVGPGRQHLGHLGHPGRRLLVDDVVGVPEEAQEPRPVQVGLDARGVIVDPERQIGGVGDVEEEALGVVLGRADVRRRSEDGAVRAVVTGEADVGDGRLGAGAGATVEERHPPRLHPRRFDDDLPPLLRGEHRRLAG